MAQGERGDSSDSPGADPTVTPGLQQGGGVDPGDTPPTADQMSGTAPDDRRGDTPNMGPVSGNRTPMFITLAIIGLFVLMVVGYGVAQIAAYLNEKPGDEQSSLGRTSVVRLL